MIELPGPRRVFDPFPQADWSDQLDVHDLSTLDWSRLLPMEPMPAWTWDQFTSRYNDWLPSESVKKWALLCQLAQTFGTQPDIEQTSLGSFREATRSAEADLYSSLAGASPPPRVFISYRSLDRRIANVLRCYLLLQGKNVWMDVWDPVLATAMRLPAPVRTVLTSAIIEIALLSSTHLVVVHTANTASSVWVPYEIGRAKHRLPVASNAAFWHDGVRTPGYAHLVEKFHRVRDAGSFAAWVRRI